MAKRRHDDETPPEALFFCLLRAVAPSSFSDGLQRIAVPFMATRINPDPSFVALAIAVSRSPWFAVSLPIGLWIDRSNPQTVFTCSTVARVASIASVLVLLLVQSPSVVAFLLTIFLAACGEVAGELSAQTLVPIFRGSLTPRKATARFFLTQACFGLLAAPLLAAALVDASLPAVSSTALVFYIVAFAQARAFHKRLRLANGMNARAQPNQARFAALCESASYVLHRYEMLGTLVLGALMMGMYGIWLAVFPTYVTDPRGLGLDACSYSLFMGVLALGVISGSVAVPRLLARAGSFSCVVCACLGLPVLLLVTASAKHAYLVGAAVYLYGVSLSAWNVSVVAYRQETVPPRMIGAVTGLYRMCAWSGLPAGAWFVSVLHGTRGSRAALYIGFGISFLQFLVLPLMSPMKKNNGRTFHS